MNVESASAGRESGVLIFADEVSSRSPIPKGVSLFFSDANNNATWAYGALGVLYFYAIYTSKILGRLRGLPPFPPTMYRPSLVYLSVVLASRSVLADFFCKYTVVISILCFSWLAGDQVGLGLHLHADCKTIAVQSGDGCASLAARCGLSGNTFMSYNPGLDCSKLVVDQVKDLLVS